MWNKRYMYKLFVAGAYAVGVLAMRTFCAVTNFWLHADPCVHGLVKTFITRGPKRNLADMWTQEV